MDQAKRSPKKKIILSIWCVFLALMCVLNYFVTSYALSWDKALSGFFGSIGGGETLSTDEIVALERDCALQITAEGVVLLRNENDALPLAKARSMRALFANAAKCEPDAQGRILIPAKLRRYAALEKEVVINGASKCVELWNPERWAPIEEAGLDPENLAAAMEELGF